MSKLTSAQLKSYLNSSSAKTFVKPVFYLYVIENVKTGWKYVTVRQNMSGEAFMRIVAADAFDDAQRIPLLWSVRKFGINAHEIKRIAAYTTREEARVVMAKMIEGYAVKEMSLNGGRPRIGASADFYWKSEKEIAAENRVKSTSTKTAKKQKAEVTASA